MEVYLKHLEWESLPTDCVIDIVKSPDFLTGCTESVRIERGENYELSGTVIGKYNTRVTGPPQDERPGATVVPFKITGSDRYDQWDFEVQDCYLAGGSDRLTLNSDEVYILTSKPRLRCSSVFYDARSELPTCWLTEWFLNAPPGNRYSSRRTSRKSYSHYERTRKIGTETRTFQTGGGTSDKLDYCIISKQDLKFILHAVPDELGPSWCYKLGIEYRSEFGRIPGEAERESISEIVSFVLGRQLLSVGYTEFSETGGILRTKAKSPWGNARSVSALSWSEPVRLKPHDATETPEATLTQVASNYLQKRDSLHMNEALWRYWLAESLPIGTSIPLLANAIEILAGAWFKSNNSKSKGVYLDRARWDSLVSTEFRNIKGQLKGEQYVDRIMNRLGNCNAMGTNERLDFFFDEIELTVGKEERDAISARNKMIHSSFASNADTMNEISRLTDLYKTLFHRVFLKLLGYTGTYVDYSVIGWPSIPLDQTPGTP